MTTSIISRIVESGVAPVAFVLMLVVGLSVDPRCLSASVRPLRRLTMDLLLVIALPPIAALLTLAVARPPAEIAAAILLIAACPVGDIANVYTLMARGSVARSLSLNSLTAVLAPFSMLLVFPVYQLFEVGHQLLTVPPRELFLRLLLFLLLPVSVGMAVRHRARDFAEAISPMASGLATAGILILLGLILANPASRPEDLPRTMAVSAIFLTLCTGLCMAILPRLQRGPGEKTALVLCLPVRNVGIAALIAISLLDDARMVGLAAVYFTLEVAVFLPLAILLGRRARNSASS